MNKHLFLYPELLSRLIFTLTLEGKYFVRATLAQQPRPANPEEIIRQIFVLSLIHHYHYPEERIKLEQAVLMGRDRKRADIVVTGDGDGMELVIEVKQDIDGDAIDQLRSYLMATGASVGGVVSGHELRCFKRTGNQLNEIDDLPMYGERPGDPINDPVPWNTPIPTTDSSAPLDPIERFDRINQASTDITIKGRTHTFSNKDLADLKKVQQRFIVDGVVFGANLRKTDWHAIIGSQFANAPAPILPAAEASTALSEPDDSINEPASSNASISTTGSETPPVLIERFERVNLNNTRITIKGRTHLFSNEDLADLKKVRQRFINDGVGLGANIWKPEWLAMIEEQFASAPPPAHTDAPILTDKAALDGFRCLRHLCDQVILDRNADGSEMRASIYELIQQAQSPEWGTSDSAKKLLRRHGVLFDGGAIYVANDHPMLRKLYKTSQWPVDWPRVLKSIYGVAPADSRSFGGRVSRASRVPLTILQRCLEATAGETPTQTATQLDS